MILRRYSRQEITSRFPLKRRATLKPIAGEENSKGTASHAGYITSLNFGFLIC